MSRILAFAVAVGLLGGCIFVHREPGPGRARARQGCKPSQHWEDGHCVHNGRGKGARKHDD